MVGYKFTENLIAHGIIEEVDVFGEQHLGEKEDNRNAECHSKN
jgi:hypothetical protein